MKHLFTWVVWGILGGILIAMFVLASRDAAATGEDVSVAGIIAAWFGIVTITWLIVWVRNLMFRGATKALEELDKHLDE